MIVTCTVCDREFQAADAASRIENEEDHYFFCSEDCRRLFDEEPGLYVEEMDDGWVDSRAN